MPYKKVKMRHNGIIALLSTQMLNELCATAFRTYIAANITIAVLFSNTQFLIGIAATLFALGFAFSAYPSGAIADRITKKLAIVYAQVFECFVILFAGVSLYLHNVYMIMFTVFLIGIQTSFMYTSKFSKLPELVANNQLPHGIGVMLATWGLGGVLGIMLSDLTIYLQPFSTVLASVLFLGVALTALIVSLFIKETPFRGELSRIHPNMAKRLYLAFREASKSKYLHTAIILVAVSWISVIMMQMSVFLYSTKFIKLMNLDVHFHHVVLLSALVIGTYLAGQFSRAQFEMGLVPYGAGLSVLALFTMIFGVYNIPYGLAIFSYGFGISFVMVPAYSILLEKSPPNRVARNVATSHAMAFIPTIFLLVAFFIMGDRLNLKQGYISIMLMALLITAALHCFKVKPTYLTRAFIYPIANFIYRIRVEGRENPPMDSGALIVSNHVSLIDPLLIAGACRRNIRFIMNKRYYDLPLLKWFFKGMGCIPVEKGAAPAVLNQVFQQAREAIIKGDLVCIFAEGEISRHGQLLRFKTNFEDIVRGLDVPIIPVHLDRVWGSIVSYDIKQQGKIILKWPRRIPYPVTVSFGRPLPSSTDTYHIRTAIHELSSEAFKHRLAQRHVLGVSFLEQAKKAPLRLAMVDSSNAKVNNAGVFVKAALLGEEIDKLIPKGESVSILIPPTVVGAVANVAMTLRGRRVINLNYTNSPEDNYECAARANANKIITARKVIEKLNWPASDNMIFLEDIAPKISKAKGLLTFAAFFLLPTFILKRMYVKNWNEPLRREATVIFTSGSMGTPKGVILTHANIISNIEGAAQMFQLDDKDRLVGILPFFHSFGYTVAIWLCLITRTPALYHNNPLDAKVVGDLVEKYKGTLIIATPSFLASYTRRVPKEKFASLRLVVAGAEKLRHNVYKAFMEKFDVKPLEGYGCTELSPVATVNILDVNINGIEQPGTKLGTIGNPLPGVTVKIMDPETHQILGKGETGLLCVKGPNVMKGYLGDKEKTAEVIVNGYYITGDIASMDDEGFVTLTDRLSRFSKIAGEMVPHIKIEDALQEIVKSEEKHFIVTAVEDEKKGEKLVVLYKDVPDIKAVHDRLKEVIKTNLWIPSLNNFYEVDEFPLLGSGKTDFKKLKDLAKELDAKAKDSKPEKTPQLTEAN